MKTIVAAGVALATVLASPAFAAPPKHHAPVSHDVYVPYGAAAGGSYMSRPADVVTLGNRVVGEDPDINIRTGIERDPVPSEY